MPIFQGNLLLRNESPLLMLSMAASPGNGQFKSDTPLLSDVATVDWDVGSGNERSARRAEPHDELGHFVRRSNPSDGMKRVHHFTSANPSPAGLSGE
jgi:hypothetical protein